MTKALWRKTIISGTPCLVPDCRDAEEWLRKTKLGQGVMIDPRRPRNIQHHRKLFALLNLAVDNWPYETPITVEGLLDTIKVATGHVRAIEVRTNFVERLAPQVWELLPQAIKDKFPPRITIHMPDSIAFEKMPQDEFSDFYDQAVAILARILGVDVETLNQEAAAA